MGGGTLPPLILLAGTSEAGKSTAGQHLARCGARRVKIRTLLLALSSGAEVLHEGVTTRDGFDPEEFLTSLRHLAVTTVQPVIVVESFIDARLASMTKASWPTACAVVFITADEQLRVHRHAAANNLVPSESARAIRAKDARKRVWDQLHAWRQVASYWIDNHGTLSDLEEALSDIMTATLNADTTRDQR